MKFEANINGAGFTRDIHQDVSVVPCVEVCDLSHIRRLP